MSEYLGREVRTTRTLWDDGIISFDGIRKDTTRMYSGLLCT